MFDYVYGSAIDFGFSEPKLFNNLSPNIRAASHFRYFHEVVLPIAQKKDKRGANSIYVKACIYTGTDVFKTIGQCNLIRYLQ